MNFINHVSKIIYFSILSVLIYKYNIKCDFSVWGKSIFVSRWFEWNMIVFNLISVYVPYQNQNENWAFSQLRICRPPPSPHSVLIWKRWKMRNVLKRIKKQFSDFYFSSYRKRFTENWDDDASKINITRKIKIWKIWNLI